MKIPLVDLHASYLAEKYKIDAAITQVIQDSAYIGGEFLNKFEDNFARFCKTRYAVGCSNGTSAIHLALLALRLKKGDRVITVPNTFIATTEAITHANGQIDFVDVKEDTALIDLDLIEKAITKDTKAIIAVDLFGQMPDMQRLQKIANYHNLYLIEDAAQAHGALWNGHKPGYYSDIATYSFFPAKVLGCFGDGGCVTTNQRYIAERVRLLRNHGRSTKYEHIEEGYNYRLDTLQAAILDAKLSKLHLDILNRRLNANFYDQYLDYNSNYEHIVQAKKAESSYYMYVLKMKNRSKFIKYMKEHNIGTGIHYPIPLHLQPAYERLGYIPRYFPIAEKLAKEIVSIPVYPELTIYQLNYIMETIAAFDKS